MQTQTCVSGGGKKIKPARPLCSQKSWSAARLHWSDCCGEEGAVSQQLAILLLQEGLLGSKNRVAVYRGGSAGSCVGDDGWVFSAELPCPGKDAVCWDRSTWERKSFVHRGLGLALGICTPDIFTSSPNHSILNNCALMSSTA